MEKEEFIMCFDEVNETIKKIEYFYYTIPKTEKIPHDIITYIDTLHENGKRIAAHIKATKEIQWLEKLKSSGLLYLAVLNKRVDKRTAVEILNYCNVISNLKDWAKNEQPQPIQNKAGRPRKKVIPFPDLIKSNICSKKNEIYNGIKALFSEALNDKGKTYAYIVICVAVDLHLISKPTMEAIENEFNTHISRASFYNMMNKDKMSYAQQEYYKEIKPRLEILA